MSRTIDDKVVSMEFDNAQFERGVKESMDTLSRLKQALDMSVVGKSVDAVQVKFSALDAMVKRTLENVADNAYHAGKRLLKSLTVDNISAGWSKFADKTSAVQTIMSATSQTWEDSANTMARAQQLMENGIDEKVAKGIADRYGKISNGTMSIAEAAKELGVTSKYFKDTSEGLDSITYSGSQMEYVQDQLARLNWFTDETSYKFLDMVNNIGKFTANNIPLEQSVTSMQGIANWAAISGANANEAGRAMYNLSQAISVGSVKLMDWKSIENANMATAEFKQTAIDTAVAMGTLKDKGNGVYETLKGNEVSVKNFNAALSDAWFSSEVLLETLDKYGGFSVKLQEISDQTGLTAAELLGYVDDFKNGELDLDAALENVHETMGDTTMTAEELHDIIESLSDSEFELGEKAFRAAQQAKTFQDVIDYVKEAVSTGWSNTFENIFGNYEEARDFWSQMAEELYGVFVEAGDKRNELLSAWKEAGGRDDLVEAFWNIFHAVTGIINAIKGAFHDVFPPATVETLTKLTSRLKDFSKLLAVTDEETGELNARGERIRDTFRGIFSVIGILKDVAVAVIKPIKNLFGGVGDGLLDLTSNLGNTLTTFRETIQESGILEKITERVGSVFKALNQFIGDTIELFRGVSFWEGGGGIAGVFESMFDGLNNVIRLFFSLVSAITGKDLSGVSDTITSVIQKIRNKVVEAIGPLSEVFDKVKTAVGKAFTHIKSVFSEFGKINVKGMFKFSDETGKALNPLVSLFEGLKNIFMAVWQVIKKVAPLISSIITGIGKVLGKVGTAISNVVRNADFSNLLDLVNGGTLTAIGVGIYKFIHTAEKSVGAFKGIKGVLEGTKKLFDGLFNAVKAWKQGQRAGILLKIAEAIGILAVSLLILSSIDQGALTSSIAAVTGLFVELMGALKFMSTIDKKSMSSMSKVGGVLVGMAAAVLVLSIALKKLSSLGWEQIAVGLTGVTVLLGEMVGVSIILSKNSSGKMMKGATNAIAFAGAIYVLSLALKSIASLGWDSLAIGLTGMTVMIGELVAASKILSSGNGGRILKGALNAVIFAAALRVLVISVKALANMELKSLAIGLGALGILIAEVVAASKILSSGNGGRMLKGAMNTLIFAAALRVLVVSVKALGSMDLETLAKGLGGLAILLTEIVAASKIMSGAASGAGALVIAAAGLLVLSAAFKSIAKMSWSEIVKALVAVGAALLVIGGASAILAPIVPAILGLAGAMAIFGVASIAFGVGLLSVSAGLAAFGAAGEVACYTLVKALEILLTAIPNLIKALAKSLAASVESLASLIISIGRALISAIRELVPEAVDVVLEVILSVIDSIATNIQPIIESLLDIVLGVIRGIASRAPVIVKETIAMFISIFSAITDALGEFDIADILEATVFMAALDALMVAIAGFAVLAVAATALLPSIGHNLNSFIKAIGPFLAEVKKVGSDTLIGAEALANMVLAFTASSVINGLTSWITGGVNLESFGKEIVAFAPYLKEFSDKITGIKPEVVKNASLAAKSITAFANTVPKRGGLVSLITGENSLADFAKELKAFADPFVYYAKAVEDIKPRAVSASSTAAKSITSFTKTIPKRGGLVSLITGENSLSDFAKELKAFADPFVYYAKAVEDIKPNSVQTASIAAKTITSFADSVPKRGGLVALITGENSLADFAEELEAFAEPFVNYAKTVSSIKSYDAVTTSSAAAKTIAEFAKIVPPVGGIVSIVTGDNSLSRFGDELAKFGPNLNKYVQSVSGLTFEKVEESAKAALKMAKTAAELPPEGGVVQWWSGESSLSKFGEELAKFGPKFKIYAENVIGIGSEDVTRSGIALKSIAEAAAALPAQDGIEQWWTGKTSLGNFGLQLAVFGPVFAKYAEEVKGVGTEDIEKSSTALATIAQAAALLPKQDGIEQWWTGQTTLSAFGLQLALFGGAFKRYANTVSGLVDDDFKSAVGAIDALVDIANELQPTGGIVQFWTGEASLADFGESIAIFGEYFQKYSEHIEKVNLSDVQSATTVLQEIFDILPENYESIEAIVDFGSTLVTFAGNIQQFTAILSAMAAETPGHEKVISSVLSDIQQVVEQLTSTDISSLENFSKALSRIAENMYLGFSNVFVNKKPDLEAIARSFASTIVIEALKKVRNYKAAGEALARSFEQGAKPTNMSQSFSSSLTACVNYIRSYYGRFKQSGMYLIEGFNAGLTTKLSTVQNAGGEVGKAAIRGLNNSLVVKSPSKAAYRSGDYTIIGFTNALRDGLLTAYYAGNNVGEYALDGLSESIRRISDRVSDEIDTQPVIRPVLDLSNVRKNVGSLNALMSYGQAMSINSSLYDEIQNGNVRLPGGGNNYNFVQNNYSPKALSRIDIYRQTKNQFSALKGRV